jgi:hypothetical protein
LLIQQIFEEEEAPLNLECLTFFYVPNLGSYPEEGTVIEGVRKQNTEII